MSGDRNTESAIKYGLVAAAIAVVIICAVVVAGTAIKKGFEHLAQEMNSQTRP